MAENFGVKGYIKHRSIFAKRPLSALFAHIADPHADEDRYHNQSYENPICNTEAKHGQLTQLLFRESIDSGAFPDYFVNLHPIPRFIHDMVMNCPAPAMHRLFHTRHTKRR
jgi:hypothetical protein